MQPPAFLDQPHCPTPLPDAICDIHHGKHGARDREDQRQEGDRVERPPQFV
jgi:hypothetical protein